MRVERIGFTPVKGGRHVAHESVVLDADGPVGDRAFCLVDTARSRVVRTVEDPSLMQTVAHWHAGVLSVRLPAGVVEGAPLATGSVLEVDYWGRVARLEVVDGPWAAAYSRFLGREVVLARAAPGEVVYAGPVSLVTTSALAWLGERVGHPVEAGRFRSTLVVDTGTSPERVEDEWIGRTIEVGAASLRVESQVPRCAVIDSSPLTGERDVSLLKALDGPDLTFGVDAVVVQAGLVVVGDEVRP